MRHAGYRSVGLKPTATIGGRYATKYAQRLLQILSCEWNRNGTKYAAIAA